MLNRRECLTSLSLLPLFSKIGLTSPTKPKFEMSPSKTIKGCFVSNDINNDIYSEFVYPTQQALIRCIESEHYIVGEVVYGAFIIRENSRYCVEFNTLRIKALCDTAKYKFDCNMSYDSVKQGVQITYSHLITEEDKKLC